MPQIVMNGNIYGEPKDKITVEPVYTEGIKICTITINGVPHDIYIPAQTQGGNE